MMKHLSNDNFYHFESNKAVRYKKNKKEKIVRNICNWVLFILFD